MSPKQSVSIPCPAAPTVPCADASTGNRPAASLPLSARRRALGRFAGAIAATTAGWDAAPALGQGKVPTGAGTAAGARTASTGTAAPGTGAAGGGTGPAGAMGARPEVQAFIDEVASRNGFDRAGLASLFGRVQRVDRVLELMTAPSLPGARRIWSEYRGRFVDSRRINDGSAFWERHSAAVRLASTRSGVPESIIVAIIGVETVYGRQTGDFRVIETLATLGFDYAPRASYFRGELEQFLLYTQENRIDPMQPRGSYAGAMGLPQFMPTSLRRWAVDLDADGRIDLMNSAADALGSVGNFLKEHGWVEGKATHYGAIVRDPASIGDLVAAGPKPSFTVEQLYGRGVHATEEVPVTEQLVLADLPEGDNPTRYVLGTENFYAITRYNRSYFYAMAVIELANALRAIRT